MIRRPPRRRRLDALKAQLANIHCIDEGIDHAKITGLLSSTQSSRLSGNSVDCALSAPATKRFINSPQNHHENLSSARVFTHPGHSRRRTLSTASVRQDLTRDQKVRPGMPSGPCPLDAEFDVVVGHCACSGCLPQHELLRESKTAVAYWAIKPPSITGSVPVMKDASSDVRNNTP